MYCVKCGVELSDGQKNCPLCATQVYHPEIIFQEVPGVYPVFEKEGERIKPISILFITSLVLALVYILLLFIDTQANHGVTWSGYATNAILLLYIWTVFPFWFRRPNPLILIPINLIAAGIYLAYINYIADGDWFLKFAFPIIAILTFMLTTVAALLRYLRKGYLLIASGIWFAVGGFTMVVEALINYNFSVSKTFIWAPYPLATCCLVGVALIVVATYPALREFLYKRLFI